MHRQTLSDYIKRTNNENLIKIQKQVSEEIRRRKIQEYEGIESEIDFLQQKLSVKEYECEELKKYKDVVDQLAGKQIILTNKDKMPEFYENIKDLKLECYRRVLEEIEEYVRQTIRMPLERKVILNIIGKTKEANNGR